MSRCPTCGTITESCPACGASAPDLPWYMQAMPPELEPPNRHKRVLAGFTEKPRLFRSGTRSSGPGKYFWRLAEGPALPLLVSWNEDIDGMIAEGLLVGGEPGYYGHTPLRVTEKGRRAQGT